MASSVAESVEIEVLFFAKAREAVGKSSSPLKVARRHLYNSGDLLVTLENAFPELVSLKRSFILALNEQYLDTSSSEPVTLSSSDQLAIIPPISGG